MLYFHGAGGAPEPQAATPAPESSTLTSRFHPAYPSNSSR